jgi:hypothetical protein
MNNKPYPVEMPPLYNLKKTGIINAKSEILES